MSRAIRTFATMIAAALVLLLAGHLWGGIWAIYALVFITLGVAAFDTLSAGDMPEDGTRAEARALSMVLAVVHFAVLGGAVFTIATTDHSLTAKVCLFAASGLFMGQVSNANAHEMIHAPGRVRRALGRWTYISLAYGHHVSAHTGVHHVHVGTPMDPNSARWGESYWRFVPRCWGGAFRAGLALEVARLGKKGREAWHPANPYWTYIGGALGCCALTYWGFGSKGLAIYLALCAYAQSQLIISDYVQHYGLRREQRADGKYEPLGPAHSWDAPHWASSALMLNAPRHADHHLHPMRGYEALRLPDATPHMPWPLPVMATIALWPRAWRAVMHPRLAALKSER